MIVSEKIKTNDDNKIEYIFNSETAKNSALSSGNGRYEFSVAEDILLEKAATIKRFEYSPLDSNWKKQTDIAKIQNQGLGR